MLFAVMWIRDGVLVNRMHVNPVAFAVAYWVFAAPAKKDRITLESLINFGFARSGISCAQKMQLFNNQCCDALEHVEEAASFYHVLATEAAKSCSYFDGAVQLLKELHAHGARNFITSAVEQSVLDAWANSEQGALIAPYVEILGTRAGFQKGADHFAYVANSIADSINRSPIYYVADAVSEITTACRYSDEYNIVPIGFGYVIDLQQIMDAVKLVKAALNTCSEESVSQAIIESRIDRELLLWQDKTQTVESLRMARNMSPPAVPAKLPAIYDDTFKVPYLRYLPPLPVVAATLFDEICLVPSKFRTSL